MFLLLTLPDESKIGIDFDNVHRFYVNKKGYTTIIYKYSECCASYSDIIETPEQIMEMLEAKNTRTEKDMVSIEKLKSVIKDIDYGISDNWNIKVEYKDFATQVLKMVSDEIEKRGR